MASRSTNTMVEGLQKMLTDLAQMKTLMDADLPFILQIETLIVDKLRDPAQRMQQAGLLPPGQAPGPDPSQGAGPPGMPAPGPSFQGGGSPGVMSGAPAPNADELRRLLQ